jgi:hypothetical protein
VAQARLAPPRALGLARLAAGLAAAAALVSLAMPAGAAPETVLDCGFEDGLDGFVKWSTVPMEQGAAEGRAHSGKAALVGRLSERGPLVHSRPGLDVPLAGSELSFFYLVPAEADFDHFEINVRTHQTGDRMFQLSLGLTRGAWTEVRLSFTAFFGYGARAFGSYRIAQFEVTAVGVGEVLLDDVRITVDPEEARRAARVPAVIGVAERETPMAPGGARSFLRRTFTLDHVPGQAWCQIGGDEEARVYLNGTPLGTSGLSPAGEFDLSEALVVGENVLAVEVTNGGDAPNPTGLVGAIGWGGKGAGPSAPDETVLVTDAAWRASSDAPEGWAESGFDDSAWAPARVYGKLPLDPFGTVDVYPLAPAVDRSRPRASLRLDAGGRKVLATLWPGRAASDPVEFTARLLAVDADMVRHRLAVVTHTIAPDARLGKETELLDLSGREGAFEVTVEAAGEVLASRILYLPEAAPERLSLRTDAPTAGTGWFRTVEDGGRWWLVGPEGDRFFSLGCNAIIRAPDWSLQYSRRVGASYFDIASWAELSCARLLHLGFNTLAGGEDALEPHRRRGVPYFSGFNITWAGPRLMDAAGNTALFPDVFDPAWQQGAEARIREVCEAGRDDPLLVGYFTDNEIQMHQPLSPSLGLMGWFWSPGAAAELVRFLRERHGGDIANLNRAWTSAYHTYAYASFAAIPDDKPIPRGDDDPVSDDLSVFARHILATYVNTVVALHRKYDPHHLVCTNRFAGQFDLRFADLLSAYDIVAINSYPRSRWGQAEFDAEQLKWIRAMHERSGRPVLITEWSVAAREAGLPSFNGRLDTDAQRAGAYARIVPQLFDEGYIVGAHWFSWVDSTDAEATNWGLVDGNDRAYRALAAAVRETNLSLSARVRAWRPVPQP